MSRLRSALANHKPTDAKAAFSQVIATHAQGTLSQALHRIDEVFNAIRAGLGSQFDRGLGEAMLRITDLP